MNKRGFAEVAVLYAIIAVMALLFVPNPVSSVIGVGVRPNKTVHTEKLVPIKVNGQEVLTEQVSESDTQQHVGFWEWLRSLPIIVLILMVLGIFFPPIALWLHNARVAIIADAKKIVASVDKGLAVIKAKDPDLHQATLDAMSKVQGENSSTEALVTDLQQK